MKIPILLGSTCMGIYFLIFSTCSGAEANNLPQHSDAAVTRCDAEAYVVDRDPNGLNVRAAPNKTAEIIGNLPNQRVEGIRVHIVGASGEWVRINRANEAGGEVDRNFLDRDGWVYGPLLGVSGMAISNGGTYLYKERLLKSAVVMRVPADESLVVRGCDGGWLFVQYKQMRGWGAPKTLCANPLTTCA